VTTADKDSLPSNPSRLLGAGEHEYLGHIVGYAKRRTGIRGNNAVFSSGVIHPVWRGPSASALTVMPN